MSVEGIAEFFEGNRIGCNDTSLRAPNGYAYEIICTVSKILKAMKLLPIILSGIILIFLFLSCVN